jgi:hypothetical protein
MRATALSERIASNQHRLMARSAVTRTCLITPMLVTVTKRETAKTTRVGNVTIICCRPVGVNMWRRNIRRDIKGSVETTVWSPDLQDDPMGRLVHALERIADALEAMQE